jgi:hypothetical protein
MMGGGGIENQKPNSRTHSFTAQLDKCEHCSTERMDRWTERRKNKKTAGKGKKEGSVKIRSCDGGGGGERERE